MANWYDYPQYYDMVFRDETADEVAFFEEAFKEFATKKVKRVLEPGCGSGRLVVAMAKKGYDVTGLDLSDPMLDYLRTRLKRGKLTADVVKGDMTDMKLKGKFDAAFCTFNTFRHLLTEKDAQCHLRNVAKYLRVGGVYILGFHILPMDVDEDSTEIFKAKAGGTSVSLTLKVMDFNRTKRQEILRASLKATKRDGSVQRIRSDFPLRLYTHRQVKSMLEKVEDVWEVASIFDFDYDIGVDRDLDVDLTDALFVLKRI